MKRILITAAAIAAGTLLIAAPAQAAPAGQAAPAASRAAVPPLTAATDHPRFSDNAAAYAAALKSPDWIKAPDGLVNKSCLIHVPNGAAISDTRITLPSGRAIAYPKRCAYPTLVAKAVTTGPRRAGTILPATNGWLMHTQWNSPSWLTGISSMDTVPSWPSVGASQVNYFFSSLQSPSSILQAVIGWGNNNSPGSGDFYYINDWYLWGSNHVVSPTADVSSGDSVYSAVGADTNSCRSDGSYCNWKLLAADETNGKYTYMSVTSYQPWSQADGGVFESYGASGCAMLPAGGSAWFQDISVGGNSYSPVTPDFYDVADNQQCSMHVDYDSTYAAFFWNP